MTEQFDVVVVGAGNAAMSAAHAALESGVSLCIIEKAPREDRGGNSMFTGHQRFAYEDVEQLYAIMRPDTITPELKKRFSAIPMKTRDQLWDEIMTATGGQSDPEMLQVHVEQSYETIAWLNGKGHNYIPTPGQATMDGNPVRLESGGEGLQEHNFQVMESTPGVAVHYETSATELLVNATGEIVGVKVLSPSGYRDVMAKSVILACGGFEANAEMRARYLGPRWDTVHQRGVPFNTGDGLRMALDIGAMPFGSWSSAHASPVDFASPPWSTLSKRRGPDAKWGRYTSQSRYAYPYAIMVNSEGRRFIDEAFGTRDMTYASMGRAILAQPGGAAFQIIDAKVRDMGLLPSKYEGASVFKAETIEDVAMAAGIDVRGLVHTVEEFNRAVPDDREAQPSATTLDGVAADVTPPKSNFAMRIDKPPFEAFHVRCGLTFTFGGLKIDPGTGQVQHVAGRPIPGLYAAGEMVGGLFHWNYPSGSGLMAGSTFGRIAGANAATQARA